MPLDGRPVLCVPAASAPAPIGFIPGWMELEQECWRPRTAELERDESWLQVIPVSVVRRADGRVLAYLRSSGGGESRLHGRWSIGAGGHVEAATDSYDIGVAITRGLIRELREELGFRWSPTTRLNDLGAIRSDHDAVSRVHLGLAFAIDVPDDWEPMPGPEVAEWRWLWPCDVASRIGAGETWEVWSVLLAEYLASAMTGA